MTFQLPDPQQLSSVLCGLLGTDISLESADSAAEVSGLEPGWGSLLIDDDDNEIGCIVSDLVSTVSLGGGLLMLPVGGLEDQVEEGEASEMAVSALGEVINVMTKTLNELEGNPHVRSMPAQPLAELSEGRPWVQSPSASAGYEGKMLVGNGRIAILGA